MKTFLLLSPVVAFLLALSGCAKPDTAPVRDGHSHGAAATVYQCPMHPWIKSDQAAARCTICGMALVAAMPDAAASADPNLVTLTSAQASVVGVQTDVVTRGPLVRTLRVTGVIDDDDTRHRILAARVPGRIEKLQVNYVGAEVAAGAPLATIFSPEMLTAQREFVERLQAGTSVFTQAERAAARERLLELGLTEEEIGILEKTRQPTAMVNVRAPMAGTVVSRAVYEGQYVAANDVLFQIGDFSRMWFNFDAAEPDLAWLQPGQTVEVSVPSLPGRVLTAPITFIDPNLNAMTRTARVRVELDNSDRLMRHQQTASASVLVSKPDTLLVPRSAVLQHGGRPVVFVARDGQAYEARQIQLGLTGDTQIEVRDGLVAGDRVVTEGALILDGQAELAHAAASGAHEETPSPTVQKISAEEPAHDAAAYALLRTLAFAAADAAAALAQDDLAAYQKNLPVMQAAADAYLAGFAPASRGPLAEQKGKLVAGSDLDAARRAFEPFSTEVADLALREHLHHREQLWVFQCPMTPVLGTGRWLSKTNHLRNPFFGSAMPGCGEPVEAAPAAPTGRGALPPGHPPLGVGDYLRSLDQAVAQTGGCCQGHTAAQVAACSHHSNSAQP